MLGEGLGGWMGPENTDVSHRRQPFTTVSQQLVMMKPSNLNKVFVLT